MTTCAYCGRAMPANPEPDARYCSERCRRTKRPALDQTLEETIVSLLEERARGKTICPSEAARATADDWRPLMERTRCAARRLVARGQCAITQGGQVQDPSTAKGPIRIRLVR